MPTCCAGTGSTAVHFRGGDPGATNFHKVCFELLLQRTRAETVARIYPHFFGMFQGWRDLRAVSVEELEEQLKPIGLWRRRARSIKGLAEYAAARNGVFPSNEKELASLAGVGQYVANAILLFQHGQPRPLLDGNMARVIERFIRLRRLADLRYDPWLQAASHWLVRCDDPISINWATLDFASAVCVPATPYCEDCVLSSRCNKSNVG